MIKVATINLIFFYDYGCWQIIFQVIILDIFIVVQNGFCTNNISLINCNLKYFILSWEDKLERQNLPFKLKFINFHPTMQVLQLIVLSCLFSNAEVFSPRRTIGHTIRATFEFLQDD